MAVKTSLLFCLQAFFVQVTLSQFTSSIASPFGCSSPAFTTYNGFAAPSGFDAFSGLPGMSPAIDITPTSGGGLTVTSVSSVPPTGISVMSENAYEGTLAVAGDLPFVGTTGVEGVVPTSGAGAVSHACGNGVNAMTGLSETSTPASVATTGIAAPFEIVTPSLVSPALSASPLTATGLGTALTNFAGPSVNGAFPSSFANIVTPNNGFNMPAFANSIAGSTIANNFAAPAFSSSFVAPAVNAFAAPALASTSQIIGNSLAAPAINTFVGSTIPCTTPVLANPAPVSFANTIPAPIMTTPIYDVPCGLDGIEITATSGGSLPVSSASPVAPTGISVAAETVYEGPLVVAGEMPFVGTVGLEGVVPTAGAGAVNHACGNGVNAMTSEPTAFTGFNGGFSPAMGFGASNIPFNQGFRYGY